MEEDLADKPHIHWWGKILSLVLFVALLFLPRTPISDGGFVSLSGDNHGPEWAPVLVELCNPTIEPHQNQQIQAVQTRQKREGKKADTREQLHSIVEEISAKYNVDPALIKAIIMAESGYNPRAVSKRGATGLMQLMPSTAKELGVKELFDPKDNVEAGVRYFKRLLRRFGGDVRLALAAYNAGSTKVRRYNGIPPIGATKYYVRKVFHYYRLYKKESVAQTDDA